MSILDRLRGKTSPKSRPFLELAQPIVRAAQDELKGRPEKEVYAELTRRLSAAGLDVPEQHQPRLRVVAGRVSRGEPLV